MNFNQKVREVALRLISTNNITIADAQAAAGPKVYKALLTQTGTDAPVATVLVNTLGDVTFAHGGTPGIFDITSADLFTIGKTVISNGVLIYNSQIFWGEKGPSFIEIGTTVGGNLQNGVLYDDLILIEVYP